MTRLLWIGSFYVNCFEGECINRVKPKVTVGVCVRNSASTVREAIESIICQDFPHELIEVIFVDDGSEDNTLSIVQEYVSKMDITGKVFHTSWQGLGAARNFVVENAEGKYIVWVDGDMILPKDHVRKQVEFMEKHPEVGIAKARYGLLSGENLVAVLENASFIVDDFKSKETLDPKLPGTGGAIYRVDAIRQVGGFDNYLKGVGEDQDAAYRVRLVGWVLKRSNALFYEKRQNNWNRLWKRHFWYGYGNYVLHQKNRKIFRIYKMVPPASFLSGLLYSFPAYRLTQRKAVFLLPLYSVFKSVAWCYGFIKAALAHHVNNQ